MDRSTVITLVSITFDEDEIGQSVPKETFKDVFCDITSVSMTEWYEAGRSGIKPDFRLTMNRYDYDDETEVIINGKRYGVYRTYFARTDDIELYVEKKAGVQNG